MSGLAIFGSVILCLIALIALLGITMNVPDLVRYLRLRSM
jgi:hypothetical protein